MMDWLKKAFPWLLIAPVVLPVIVWSGLIYPYLVPKTLLFYALTLLSVAAFALLAAHDVPFYWGRLARKEAWLPALLVLLAYVASYFGIGFYHSFWSLFVRGDGLLMLTCAVASFYLILLYADRALFNRFIRAITIVACVVAVYGIGEWLLAGGRIGSLLGNPAFFAGYLTLALFPTWHGRLLGGDGWRKFAIGACAAEVIAITLSATRGSMLALGVAALAILGFLAWKGKGRARQWSAGALVALLVVAGGFFALRSELAKVPFEPIARIASISTKDVDIASRLFIWSHMLAEVGQHPWLGVGAEHIDALFNQFYEPTQIQEQWFDRSHNAFLDYAAQYGIGGFVLYALIILSFLVAARRFERRGERGAAAAFALTALVYAAQNFFVFDTVSSFWLMLALLSAALAVSDAEVPAEKLHFPQWSQLLAWPLALVIVLLIIPVSIRPAMAAYDLSQAYLYQLVDPSLSASLLKRGMALGTYGDLEYGYEAYDMYASNQSARLTGDSLQTAYAETLAILEANYEKYPYDARTALYLAHVLSLAPDGKPDSALLSEALTRAIAESPNRYQSWYILANLSLTDANAHPAGSAGRAAGYAAAEDVLQKYLGLVPGLAEPHFVLAEIFYATNDKADAASEAALGKKFYRPDLETAQRAASYYVTVQDWPNAVFFLSQEVQQAPTDYASMYDLAKAQYLSGDKASALKTFEELQKADPSIVASDPNFVQAITQYAQSL